jgi:hypothetical protein
MREIQKAKAILVYLKSYVGSIGKYEYGGFSLSIE